MFFKMKSLSSKFCGVADDLVSYISKELDVTEKDVRDMQQRMQSEADVFAGDDVDQLSALSESNPELVLSSNQSKCKFTV